MWRPDTAGATLSGSTRTLEAPQLLTRAGLQSGPEVLAAPPGLSVTSNLPHSAPDFTASSGEIRGSGQKVSAGFGAFYRPQPQGQTRGTCGFRARATDTALGIRTTRIAPSALQGDGLYGCGHGGGPSGEGGSGGDRIPLDTSPPPKYGWSTPRLVSAGFGPCHPPRFAGRGGWRGPRVSPMARSSEGVQRI